ncbi:hypothetical protein PROFUN_00033 [Planoprotostelium fungivorum]|uniref:LMBR1 domain-containing protein 2 n=1 Tax=Planoprotostelium fungivorum TaxID=1890364 RepID=A0A2P6P0F6_9EUKA|nr:hypothetical protein PROFUN_00033 [Planoprotostelium fungivorum]
MKGWWLFALGLIILAIGVTRWYLNFSIILLVPLDIARVMNFLNSILLIKEQSKHEKCIQSVYSNTTLVPTSSATEEELHEACGGGPWILVDKRFCEILWYTIYWTTYILCWTAYPITQSFNMVGEFFFFEKIRAAIRLNLIFYAIYAAIGFVLVFAGLLWNQIKVEHLTNIEMVRNVAVAASNSYGMFLMMCFLGYSLVENVGYYWRHSDDQGMLNYYYFLAARYKDNYINAKKHLDKVLKQIRMYEEKTPTIYKDVYLGEGDSMCTYEKLVNLNHDLKECMHSTMASRSLYVNLLHRTFHLEDVIDSKRRPSHVIEWEFETKRTGRLAFLGDRLEWIWYHWLHRPVFILLALLCTCMGLIIIWSEEVFSLQQKLQSPVELSIFAHMLHSDTLPFEILVGYYRLHVPYNTYSGFLLTFPIAYNFMLMSKTGITLQDEQDSDTAFSTIYSRPIKRALPMFEDFSYFFPLILGVLCILTFFDVWSKIILNCCVASVRRFTGVYDKSVSAVQIVQGKEFVAEERERKRRGEAFSIDSVGIVPQSQFNMVDETGLPVHQQPAEQKPFSFQNLWTKMSSTTNTSNQTMSSSLEMINKTVKAKPPHRSNNSKVEGIRAKYSKPKRSNRRYRNKNTCRRSNYPGREPLRMMRSDPYGEDTSEKEEQGQKGCRVTNDEELKLKKRIKGDSAGSEEERRL